MDLHIEVVAVQFMRSGARGLERGHHVLRRGRPVPRGVDDGREASRLQGGQGLAGAFFAGGGSLDIQIMQTGRGGHRPQAHVEADQEYP